MITTQQMNEFATAASVAWGKRWKYSVPSSHIDDVAQDLGLRFLEDSTFREVVKSCRNSRHRVSILVTRAHELFGEIREGSLVANNRVLYSVSSVKELLKGRSSNKQLLDLLPEAMDRLRERHEPYAEVIESRYGRSEVPNTKTAENCLMNAHIAITGEINRANRRQAETHNGPSMKHAVPPEERKAKGGSSDPTYEMAMGVMSSDEAREAFYVEEPLPVPHKEITGGSSNPAWNIFDHEFMGMPGLDSYRASVYPDLYPNERSDYVFDEAS